VKEVPSNARTPEERSYWLTRQQQLQIKTNGTLLRPTEVIFAEHFIKAGQKLEWIGSTNSSRPTNDLVWLNNGYLTCEAKLTTAKYKRIAVHIRKSMLTAALWGIAKETFIVDIGNRHLSELLAHQLSRYNMQQTMDDALLKNLYLMSDDGSHLTEIKQIR
jgi:hypothetical protein